MMDADTVPTTELSLGDIVWFTHGRGSWAMVIGLKGDFVLPPEQTTDELQVIFDDGTATAHYPQPGETWKRSNVVTAGFRPQDVARAVEHHQKTLEGLQRKIGRLQVLSGLVQAAEALRAAKQD